MIDLLEFLRGNPYPGRGLVIGTGAACYFIMGRSVNSRNRIFTPTPDGIRTEALDPSKLEDPSLIIYHPVRRDGTRLIVTNGDQTDTIRDLGDFRQALSMREYEPDDPNWTPRISAVLNDDGSFELAILKRVQGRCVREFFSYEGSEPGTGFFLSTYEGPGSPLPSFSGEPREVRIPEPDALWAALDPENKISLYTNMHGEVRIFNKHLGD